MKRILKYFLILLPVLCFVDGFSDSVTREGASGSKVVEHVVDLLSSTCFLNNELFFRRMAFVETHDGTSPRTYRAGYHGGIWNIDESQFKTTQKNNALTYVYQQIKLKLNIDWSKVTWRDLRQPINSGLAAMMFVLSRGITNIPETPELQATVWSTLRGGSSATTFYFETLKLDAQCTLDEELDIIVVLDFANLAPRDLVAVQGFLTKLLRQFPISQDKTRVGIVTKRVHPIAAWYLNSQRHGFTILGSLKVLIYETGPNTTGDSLVYARETMLKAGNGHRKSAATVVLLLTDGVTDFTNTYNETKKLEQDGASLVIIEVNQSGGTPERELRRLVGRPKCRHARVVKAFSDLNSTTEELQQVLCKAPLLLSPGNYTYDCEKTVRVLLPDTSKSTSIKAEVTGSNGSVEIYASRTFISPDETGYDVHITDTATLSPVLFLRGIHPIHLTAMVRNASQCMAGTFTLHVKDEETFTGTKLLVIQNGPNSCTTDNTILEGADGVCVIGGTVRSCDETDMRTAINDIVLVDDPVFPYLCNTGNHSTVEYYPHPLDANLFVMCDVHERQFVGLCPVNRTSCVQSTSGCKYANPCTADAILNNDLLHTDPCGARNGFIKCSHFGTAEYSLCPQTKVWNQDTKACSFTYVHNALNITAEIKNIANPCIHAHADHVYFPHPRDTAKYIFCDAEGNAYEQTCKGGRLWNQQTKTCSSISPVKIG